MADIKKMIEEIKTMTVVELNDLVKAIEEEFGVSAAAMAVAAPAGGAEAAAGGRAHPGPDPGGRADRALYSAKKAGRDQLKVAVEL